MNFKIRKYEFLPNKKLIGKAIKNLRLSKDKYKGNVELLANDLHISGKTVYSWEEGISLPGLDNLIDLSRVLEVPIDSILLPNSEFEKVIRYRAREKDLYYYDYYWYLIEKKTFSFLNDIENEKLRIDYEFKIAGMVDNNSFSYDLINEKLKNKYKANYRTELTDEEKDAIMYGIRRKLMLYFNKNNQELFLVAALKSIFDNDEINEDNLRILISEQFDEFILSDFDRGILSTALLNYDDETGTISKLLIKYKAKVFAINNSRLKLHKKVDTKNFDDIIRGIYSTLPEVLPDGTIPLELEEIGGSRYE